MDDERSRARIFMEDVLRLRIKGKSDSNDVPITANTPDDLINIVKSLDSGEISGNLSELQQFREMSSDAESRYRIYDEMETDSVISSALDMYADDATQYNIDGKVIWAESEDSDVAAFANRLIDIFQLNSRAWDHIRSLVKYGDLYLELFRDDESGDDTDPYDSKDASTLAANMKMYVPKLGSELEEYIEKVENPSIIYELFRKGKTVGFVKTKQNDTNQLDPNKHFYQTTQISNEDILMPSDKYVHIFLPSNDRFSQTVDMEVSGTNGTKVIKYKVNRGKSILQDLYKTYKELRLMEDAILLNRVTRSSIIRILQIEMGDMPKSQARETLKRFKQIIEQKNFMDKDEGTYSSQASPGPIDNCIYVPTYNGKGSISASNLGGDVDIKSIVDIDYFRQKLAGGLKIPLSYISGTSQENGLGGGTSLTKIDARYARTVKRIQNAYIQGITNLINIFAVNHRLEDHVNNFTIKMVSPSTQEDADRNEDLSTKLDLAGSILDILNNLEDLSYDSKKEIIIYLMSDYLKESEIADILKEDEGAEEDLEDEGEPGGGFDSIPSGGGPGGFDEGAPDFVGPNEGSDDDLDNLDNDIDNDIDDLDIEASSDEDFGDFEDAYDEEI